MRRGLACLPQWVRSPGQTLSIAAGARVLAALLALASAASGPPVISTSASVARPHGRVSFALGTVTHLAVQPNGIPGLGGDTVTALGKGDVICGGGGRGHLSGGAAAATLRGGLGRDVIRQWPAHVAFRA